MGTSNFNSLYEAKIAFMGGRNEVGDIETKTKKEKEKLVIGSRRRKG